MFEIRSENQHGIFHVKLNRTLSSQEIMQLASIAANVVPRMTEETIVYTVQEPDEATILSGKQTRLGERPVDSIQLGSYKEPDVGVRIRMLDYPADNKVKVAAVKSVRKHTGISLVGAKEIVCGNYRCPILTMDIAQKIVNDFKEVELYASIVDMQCKNEVEG